MSIRRKLLAHGLAAVLGAAVVMLAYHLAPRADWKRDRWER